MLSPQPAPDSSGAEARSRGTGLAAGPGRPRVGSGSTAPEPRPPPPADAAAASAKPSFRHPRRRRRLTTCRPQPRPEPRRPQGNARGQRREHGGARPGRSLWRFSPNADRGSRAAATVVPPEAREKGLREVSPDTLCATGSFAPPPAAPALPDRLPGVAASLPPPAPACSQSPPPTASARCLLGTRSGMRGRLGDPGLASARLRCWRNTAPPSYAFF